MAPSIVRQLRERKGDHVSERAANEIERLRVAFVKKELETTRLRTVLNRALGVIVEFGDLNGFRNTTNEELGKIVTSVAEQCAEILNNPDSSCSEFPNNSHEQ